MQLIIFFCNFFKTTNIISNINNICLDIILYIAFKKSKRDRKIQDFSPIKV